MSFMFLVRGIVDKINETINSRVIATRLKKVKLDNSSSPNETIKYKIN